MMTEEDDPPPDDSANANDSSGDEGDTNLKKKLKTKKKKNTAKLRDESMKSASSNETSSKKPPSSKARRAKTMNDVADGGGKANLRRKSTDTSTSRNKDNSLSIISKVSRRGSKTVGDEQSAVSGGSGDSRSQFGSRKGGRTRSPNRETSEDTSNSFGKKKGPSQNRRKSTGGTSQPQQQGFDPDASVGAMWDVPSFGVETSTAKPDAPGFAAAFDTRGTSPFTDFNDATFADNAFPTSSTFGGAFNNNAEHGTSTSTNVFDTPATFSGDSGGFGGNAFGGSAFGVSSSNRDSLEKSPHKDPPSRKTGKLALVKEKVFSQSFACPPVKNPLTGNIIFCNSRDGEMYIQEVDPMRNFVQVLSSPILTPELHKKVTARYSRSAYGIDNVLKLCVGIHESHGQPRVRVVACLDLLVLDSKHILRAIAVWQWGYGSSQPVSLQFLLSPPSGTDYAYDPESILAADNIVFVAGASAKGPCVFMCKPSLRESWSANFLAPSGKITSMAVTHSAKRKHPYLAVGMADGSLSVWTYAAALRQPASKKSEPFRRLLYPLCRLDALWVLNSVQPTSLTEEHKQKAGEKADTGMCTNLDWLPPQPSLSSLLLLAAGFQGGFAMFHVALPYVADEYSEKFIPIPIPTQSTQLTATPQIRPFAAIRFPSQLQDVFVSWLDLGPHSTPCVALLLHGKSQDEEPGKVVLGAINAVEYRKGIKSKESLSSLRLLASTTWRSKSKAFPQGLLSCSGLSSLLCHVGEGIVALHPSFSSNVKDASVKSLRYPVFSNPPGVDSAGEVFNTDGVSDKEGTLHIFSVSQCDLVKHDQHPNLMSWSRPARRHWLCRTICGDRKEMQAKEESRESSQFGEDEDLVVGGSLSEMICELEGKALTGLVPFRIVRCYGKNFAGILFRHALGQTAPGVVSGFSTDCVAIALVSTDKGGDGIIEIIEGRDIAFLPSTGTTIRALVLNKAGGALSLYQEKAGGWSGGASYRPILGVTCDDTYVEAHRIFVTSVDRSHGLIVVGRRFSDDRTCCLRGPMVGADQLSEDKWSSMLPELAPTEPCFLLEEGEEVVSLISLPPRPGSELKLAVATSKRLLILNLNLAVLAKTEASLAAGALAPVGSSTVSFCSADAKIQYLTCLRGRQSSGTVCTLPVPRFGYGTHLLLALRPDRVLYVDWHTGSMLTEHGVDPDCFMLPTAITKPAILLEPLVANAICDGKKKKEAAVVLRGVIEKFGRKVASITHGDNEGVGNRGTGITPRVYELLKIHGHNQAGSWLLTGGVQFERSTNSKILPPWMPVAAKREAALNSDAFLHLVANGDQYMSEYIQSPDHNMPSSLPRPGDSTPYLCHESGQTALLKGDAGDALKLLDMAGTDSAESMLLQLSMVLEIKSGDNTGVLKSLCGWSDGSLARTDSLPTATASLAALCTSAKLHDSNGMNINEVDFIDRWMKPLAPSLQRGTQFRRARQRLLGERDLYAAGANNNSIQSDPPWDKPCNESRHIWNEGPNKEKESLLLLGEVRDWLGARRPTLLGKAGVQAAEERGEGALANILDMDKEEDSVTSESDNDTTTKGWDEGVGESRQDEENLSAYYRFWEGEDDENLWNTEGFSDLSRFQSKATIVGQDASITVQPTQSSVDEGEPGKVKQLYDLVFEEADDQEPSGLAIAATRGNSIDIGVLHHRDRSARQRCTLEFWYYIPPSSMVKDEVILVRRTFGDDADDFSRVCIGSDKRSMLWELALMTSGELEFRTCGGSVLKSTQNYDGDNADEGSERSDLVAFDKWNHVCLILNSRDQDKMSGCTVTLFMMGSAVASQDVSMLPPSVRESDLEAKADALLEKSHLILGTNHPASFRITEIRIFACERTENDIKMMMREYLDAAEAKKKFRVKIRGNKKGGGKGSTLAPPKAGGLVPPKAGGLGPPKGGLSPPKAGSLAPPKGSKGSLLAPPKGSARPGLLAPPKAGLPALPKDRNDPDSPGWEAEKDSSDLDLVTGFETAFGSFGVSDASQDGAESPLQTADFPTPTAKSPVDDEGIWGALPKPDNAADPPKQSLWHDAPPLSKQVRSSAAAALIRGPPATRHFGGNRGGLPDLKGQDRYGVGGIAICGSEKTIVWRDEEDPPALTYPIGASGAIVSDQLDDEEQSEFLCCFLAKDKRMVVFELNSRTVVVELQMTTKLNFWRFLPPEAGQSTLCFMLITPVGGFHWMPLDDSPRPRQVWKRGSDLQGKKIVSYEEGGTNGGTGSQMISKCGLICATDSNGTGTLEAWIVPICGDSGSVLASSDAQGAAFCVPSEDIEGEPFMPHLVQVVQDGDKMRLLITEVVEPAPGSVSLGKEIVSEVLPMHDYKDFPLLDAPTLAMGVFPESMICSLGNIIVVLHRAKGVMLAYEYKNNAVRSIAKESIGHYVVDAVLRYSCSANGGAEIVMLLSDNDNHKDGRIASYHFRSSV